MNYLSILINLHSPSLHVSFSDNSLSSTFVQLALTQVLERVLSPSPQVLLQGDHSPHEEKYGPKSRLKFYSKFICAKISKFQAFNENKECGFELGILKIVSNLGRKKTLLRHFVL